MYKRQLLDLSLLPLLGVFEVTLVTKLHHVARLVDLPLEAAQSTFNRFAISNNNLNLDTQFSGGASYANEENNVSVKKSNCEISHECYPNTPTIDRDVESRSNSETWDHNLPRNSS